VRAQRATAMGTEGVRSGGWVGKKAARPPALQASSFVTPLSSTLGVNTSPIDLQSNYCESGKNVYG
jgi:hypothetical protein